MGSNLFRKRGGVSPDLKVWLAIPLLAQKGLSQLALTAAGDEEADPVYRGLMSAKGSLKDYYGILEDTLRRDWELVTWGYDWRKDTRSAAAALVQFLLTKHPGRNVWIVGHSLGGLVARLTYVGMVNAGSGGLVKRVLTLGTPSWGSYSSVWGLSRLSSTYHQLTIFLQFARQATSTPLAPSAITKRFDKDLDKVFTTWVSIYQLLPSRLGPGAGQDPGRQRVHQLATWQTLQPTSAAAHLAATNQWEAEIATARPPAALSAQVIGYGIDTPERMVGEAVEVRDSYTMGAGDGTVAEQLGRLPEVPTYRLPAEHSAITRHPKLLQDLASLLRDGLGQDRTIQGEVLR